ncbi:MAG: SDR family NAD(P)-dependent oxidoreductase, partial [Acidimicrobiales bacterium]
MTDGPGSAGGGCLSGRSVIITGAGRGLGLAAAEALAGAGARVHLADIAGERVEQATGALVERGHDAVAHRVDVSDEPSVERLLAAVDDAPWGLVNNAAMADAVGGASFWELDRSTWDTLMGVNLTGTWLVSKHVAPAMMAAGEGRIVNLASDAALYGSPRLAHYIASKGGVVALTRAMARELGPHNITVNAVAPGIVVGESTERVPAERHELYADNRALPRAQQP